MDTVSLSLCHQLKTKETDTSAGLSHTHLRKKYIIFFIREKCTPVAQLHVQIILGDTVEAPKQNACFVDL